MNLRERLLSNTTVYRTFKRVVLPSGTLEKLVVDHFVVPDGGKVLDLGCGFGDYAPFFANRCDYLGIDHNQSYIETARRMNSGTSARFIVADVVSPEVAENAPFDLVMLSGVLHHLSASAVELLAAQILPLLSDGGSFVAMEPVFHPDQRLSARVAIASDRGRYVRDEDGYLALLRSSFPSVRSLVVPGLLRMPYTHVFLQATRS